MSLGSVLKLVLFNVSDINSGIDCTLCKFTGDTKRCGAINTPRGRHAIQRNLDRLKQGAQVNLMGFNKNKHVVIYERIFCSSMLYS